MNTESSPLASDSVHADHHDASDLIDEFRRRQLNLFRERQNDLDADESTSAH
ncbi:hypothetical protein [Cryobacterium algoritolerans]|jgi:hypothetical protein|uniref:hypothetical protein n=1 Tax=Cryobacterium algoritolerans TaxID=1259184 RepID=UPI00141B7AFA|nr:hypothetical protein [Cryobacterium algoritolerans]